jgi:pimeloyl-ACP methyl ester carboxylesterase
MRISIFCLASLLLVACNDNSPAPPADAAVDLMQPVGVAMEAACTDAIDAVYAAPSGALPTEGGTILACAKDQDLPQAQLQAAIDMYYDPSFHYTARPVAGGAHLYRVLYKTERGSNPVVPGYSSALVLLPDTPRATKLPVVVFNHGTRGEAANCAPSKSDPADYVAILGDFARPVYSLVGAGYAVIAPDNAGYANWNAQGVPLAGFLAAADEAKSALDGAKALRKLIPSSLTDGVVLAGHSQGGHTTLAALALAPTYGTGGTLAGVVVESPVWFSIRSFGALLALASSYPFSTSPDLNAFSIWYHYTAGELLDGQGHGVDVFAASKQAAVKDFVQTVCYPAPGMWDKLTAMGSNAADIFDPTWINSVSQVAAGLQASCNTGDALCTKWMQRYFDDRPHVTGAAAQVPILLAWGAADSTITSDRIQCVVDRLKSDMANIDTLCVEPGVEHGEITGAASDTVSDWIAYKTLGGPAPAACPQTTITDSMGQPAVCSSLPPNTP